MRITICLVVAFLCGCAPLTEQEQMDRDWHKEMVRVDYYERRAKCTGVWVEKPFSAIQRKEPSTSEMRRAQCARDLADAVQH